jgi:hypothetical protein
MPTLPRASHGLAGGDHLAHRAVRMVEQQRLAPAVGGQGLAAVRRRPAPERAASRAQVVSHRQHAIEAPLLVDSGPLLLVVPGADGGERGHAQAEGQPPPGHVEHGQRDHGQRVADDGGDPPAREARFPSGARSIPLSGQAPTIQAESSAAASDSSATRRSPEGHPAPAGPVEDQRQQRRGGHQHTSAYSAAVRSASGASSPLNSPAREPPAATKR